MKRAALAWGCVLAIVLGIGVSIAHEGGAREGFFPKVSGIASGAGVDTCTGDGCQIGPAGISTDGGIINTIGDITTVGKFSSTIASGSVGAQFLTGAKVALGTAGVATLLYDGTDIVSSVGLEASGSVGVKSGTAIWTDNGTTSTFSHRGVNSEYWQAPIFYSAAAVLTLETAATDAQTSSTVAALNILVDTVLTANDLAVKLTTGGATKFSIDYEGDIVSAANNGTAGSGTGITVAVAGAIRPFVHKITVDFTAMTAAATTDITLWTLPDKTHLTRMVADYTIVFDGGAISDLDVVCGKTAGTNSYLITHDVDTAIGTYGEVAAEIGASLLSATVADINWGGTQTVICRFTCTGANCNAATTGSVTYYLEGVTYP